MALANAGVPDRVIDVLVAMSYPDAFAIAPSATTPGSLAINEPRGGGGGGIGDLGSAEADCPPLSFSVYGWGGCSPFGYFPYGYLPYGYSPYGYSRYGYYSPYGTGFGAYGGWYGAGQPAVIVLKSGDNAGQHGQVVNGRGYVQGRSGDTTTATSSGGTSSTSSASSPSGSSSSGSSSSGSSGGGGDRTAHPR